MYIYMLFYFILSFYLLRKCFNFLHLFVKLNKIPTYSYILSWLGQFMFALNAKGVYDFLLSISTFTNEKGGVTKFWLGPYPVIAVTNPEDADTILSSCLNKSYVYKFTRPWVGDGLVTSRASLWRRHIKKILPAFNQKVIDGFINIFNEQSVILVEKLVKKVDKEPFDIYPFIGAANLSTICQTAMGTKMDFQSAPNHPYMTALKSIFEIITVRSCSIWLHSKWLFDLTKLKTEQDNNIGVLHKVSNDIIEYKKSIQRRNEVDDTSNTTSFRAFLDLILDVNMKEDIFTAQQLREQVDTFVAAGHETSSHAVLFTLLNLGTYQDVQDKVYEELKEVFNGKDGPVEKCDLTKLVYLDAVLKESLRLYPVIPIVLRYIDKEVKLKNYTIPKGCNSAISIWGLNRSPIWGKDCDEFRPERWLDPNELPKHPASFATFSCGRRICIGWKYSMVSMKIMLSHLLRRYSFSADITRMKLNVHFIMKPAQNHLLQIRLRE